MNRVICFLSFILYFHSGVFSQWDNLVYDDSIYSDRIHTVQFHVTGLPLTQPIIHLDASTNSLQLNFDDLGGELQRYYYTFLHCNADWTPSDLSSLEFLEGFNEEEIRNPEFSFNTLTEFTHYKIQIPNRDIRWTKSGNYILAVYDEDDKLVLTRRFLVAEPLVLINPRLTPPASARKYKTHQEIDFSITYEKLNVKNPRSEISATIIQNGNWNSAITNVKPLISYENESVFDYQNKISFPAGNEFRGVDLRSFQHERNGVSVIEEFSDVYEVTLFIDPVRKAEMNSYIDINGAFTVENLHRNIDELESDYAMVLFSLEKRTPYENADVYLYGKVTDWKIYDRFKMTYNEKVGGYLLDVMLKQGFYDYAFAVVSDKDKSINLELTESNWHETENEYTIFIYYRPFGERYDRLVGAYTFSSSLRN